MRRRLACLALLAAAVLPAAFAQAQDAAERTLTVYSGRGKSLVEPLLKRFEEQSGVRLEVRYAESPDLASLLLQEGAKSPADVFFSQDPGALGAVEKAGLLTTLPLPVLERVPPEFRSDTGRWVGTSGRERCIAYSSTRVSPDALPASVFDLTQPEWKGRVGWAPTNASFQLFITALRKTAGDAQTSAWLRGMKANGVRDYPSNRPVIQAIADGEIDLGLVNHYYLAAFKRDRGAAFPVENHFPRGDIGAVMSVAGAGVLASSDARADAERFVAFLLSDESQAWFASQTAEFPLVRGLKDTAVPAPEPGQGTGLVDLSELGDLRGTQALLRETGVLP